MKAQYANGVNVSRTEVGMLNISKQQANDQMSGPSGQKRTAEIEKAFFDNRAWSLIALSAKIGVSYGTMNRTITRILKMQKLSKKWVPNGLISGQLECMWYIPRPVLGIKTSLEV